MIASPNYVFGIYDGDDSDATGRPRGPARLGPDREALRGVLRGGRASRTRTPTSTAAPTTARSSRSASPSGGLFTGAEGLKTAEEAARFGGKAGVAYDKCYHQACDTIANINDKALEVNTGAIATAAFVYAYARDLPGRPAPPGAPPLAVFPRAVTDPARGSSHRGEPGTAGPGTGAGGLEAGHDHGHGALLR